jgi:hypothetical protein
MATVDLYMCGVDRWGDRHSSLSLSRLYLYMRPVCVGGVCMYKYKCRSFGCAALDMCDWLLLLLLTLARRWSHVVKLARRLTLSRLGPTTPPSTDRHRGMSLPYCQHTALKNNLSSTIFIANSYSSSHMYIYVSNKYKWWAAAAGGAII